MLIKTIKKDSTTYSLFKMRGIYIIRAVKENGDTSIFMDIDKDARDRKPHFGRSLTCLRGYSEFIYIYIGDDMFCNDWTGETWEIKSLNKTNL